MNRFHRLFAFDEINDDRDFDLTGRNHLDIHPFVGERFEHLAGHAGMTLHADTDERQLADFFRRDDLAETDFRLKARKSVMQANALCITSSNGKIVRRPI